MLPEINAPEPFLGLNVNPGYDHIQREIIDEFVAHRPRPLKVMVGKYNPLLKVGWSLKYPMAMPDFLSPMQGHFIATVLEEDGPETMGKSFT